jgi:poly(3-hydroxyoctanoate) depolymerase
VSVQEFDLRIQGLRIYARQTGAGQPLLLINGIGAHTEMWAPLERALAGLQIISFDAPGAGRSQTPILPRTIGALAGIVEELLDDLGQECVDVLGYSFGGAIAQEFARRTPERVRRLVLAASTPGWGGVPGERGAVLLMSTPLRYYSRRFYEHTIGSLAGGRARYDPDFVRRRGAERLRRPPDPYGYTGQVLSGSLWSSLPWLERLPQPTLVVSGDDDPLTPVANGMILASRIPHARMFVVRGEGHLMLLDEDSAALPAIRDFLMASSHTASDVWGRAIAVDAESLAHTLRVAGPGAQPWGAASTVLRRRFLRLPEPRVAGPAR